MSEPAALSGLLSQVIDHRGKTPKKLGGDFVDEGIEVVSAIHIKSGRIDWAQRRRFVSREMYERWMPVRLMKDDLLLTSEAPLGEVALVPDDRDLVLSQRLFALRGNPAILHTPYLYYYFQTSEGQSALSGRSSGTTVLGIRQSELLQIRVLLPPPDQQRRIAKVLGELDDLIDTNERTICRLGALADEQFKEAQLEGEPKIFADVVDVFGGGTPSTSKESFWNGDVAWATPTDLTALRSPYLFGTSKRITAEGLRACSSRLNPVGSVLMTSRATIGRIAITQTPAATNQGFIVLQPRDPEDRVFFYHELKSRVNEFISRANGSTFLEISRGTFKSLSVNWPSAEARLKLHSLLAPLHDAAIDLEVENAMLRRTRDELLPLLMSGKVRVRPAEDAA